MEKLSESQIVFGLLDLPLWIRRSTVITRTFEFIDFPEAMRFVNQVAIAAEAAWHHPDIDIRWNKVTLCLTTHDCEGLTNKDFQLAKTCDRLAAATQSEGSRSAS